MDEKFKTISATQGVKSQHKLHETQPKKINK